MNTPIQVKMVPLPQLQCYIAFYPLFQRLPIICKLSCLFVCLFFVVVLLKITSICASDYTAFKTHYW